ncbi:CLUMA_CG016881, isoform A [Clunio marinus]|uniref:CLUMA_CG016881, isoform A n=1 Tax=Clunio marinus TaxID=568069 RepID=A0A1J1IVF3_9DIPT|nr:CLUMA_CG016881, isoform A [Clunio marinus]
MNYDKSEIKLVLFSTPKQQQQEEKKKLNAKPREKCLTMLHETLFNLPTTSKLTPTLRCKFFSYPSSYTLSFPRDFYNEMKEI